MEDKNSITTNGTERPISPYKITNENVEENINKLMYLFPQLAHCVQRRWESKNLLQKYTSLYNKYNRLDEKNFDKQIIQKSNLKRTSPFNYIISNEIDLFTLNRDELETLYTKLLSMIEDVESAIELHDEAADKETLDLCQKEIDTLKMDMDKINQTISEKQAVIDKIMAKRTNNRN